MKTAVTKSGYLQRSILDSLFRYADFLHLGDVHIKFDRATGLKAIVAIHNLKRGSAIGGCRCIQYDTADHALEDAMRLAYMMSMKAAISDLPHGGAKAVILRPKIIKNRKRYFEVFGDFVHELGGKYITAVDSGTCPLDMDIVATRTPHVTSTTASGTGGDPSPETALGVRLGIEAAVKFKLKKDSVEGLHIAIQGVGHVGFHLAKQLKERGARVTVTDVNPIALQRCLDALNVEMCSPDAIYDVPADVFSPCALGPVLSSHTIKRLRASIIAGAANSQLAHHHHAFLLQERGILYVPDFLINAGGLIYVAEVFRHGQQDRARERITYIYDMAMEIFERSEKENKVPNEIAENIAIDRLR